MRLLEKEKIDKAQALEAKLQIDRGLKLAGSVDSLRAKRLKEEEEYRIWKEETLKVVQTQINEAIVRRDNARKEAEIAEKRRFEAQAPLDLKKERERNEKQFKANESTVLELLNRETSVISRESSVEVREKDVASRERGVREKETLVNQQVSDTRTAYDEAARTLSEAESKRDQMETDMTRRYAKLVGIETDLALREKNVQEAQEGVIKDKEDIAKERKHLESQQQTLRAAWAAYRKLKK